MNYSPMAVPAYQEGRYGNWRVTHREPRLIMGYFNSGFQVCADNWVLSRIDEEGELKTWMSLTPMELESQSYHATEAKGHTVIMGLGMGVLLYNVLMHGVATKVTVIERDPEVFAVFERVCPSFRDWPNYNRFDIRFADALTWRPDERVDTLLIDIWAKLGEDTLLGDTQRIQSHVGASRVASWGQELEFLVWLNDNGYSPPPTYQNVKRWRRATGVPWIADHTWPAMAMAAGLNTIRGMREKGSITIRL